MLSFLSNIKTTINLKSKRTTSFYYLSVTSILIFFTALKYYKYVSNPYSYNSFLFEEDKNVIKRRKKGRVGNFSKKLVEKFFNSLTDEEEKVEDKYLTRVLHECFQKEFSEITNSLKKSPHLADEKTLRLLNIFSDNTGGYKNSVFFKLYSKLNLKTPIERYHLALLLAGANNDSDRINMYQKLIKKLSENPTLLKEVDFILNLDSIDKREKKYNLPLIISFLLRNKEKGSKLMKNKELQIFQKYLSVDRYFTMDNYNSLVVNPINKVQRNISLSNKIFPDFADYLPAYLSNFINKFNSKKIVIYYFNMKNIISPLRSIFDAITDEVFKFFFQDFWHLLVSSQFLFFWIIQKRSLGKSMDSFEPLKGKYTDLRSKNGDILFIFSFLYNAFNSLTSIIFGSVAISSIIFTRNASSKYIKATMGERRALMFRLGANIVSTVGVGSIISSFFRVSGIGNTIEIFVGKKVTSFLNNRYLKITSFVVSRFLGLEILLFALNKFAKYFLFLVDTFYDNKNIGYKHIFDKNKEYLDISTDFLNELEALHSKMEMIIELVEEQEDNELEEAIYIFLEPIRLLLEKKSMNKYRKLIREIRRIDTSPISRLESINVFNERIFKVIKCFQRAMKLNPKVETNLKHAYFSIHKIETFLSLAKLINLSSLKKEVRKYSLVNIVDNDPNKETPYLKIKGMHGIQGHPTQVIKNDFQSNKKSTTIITGEVGESDFIKNLGLTILLIHSLGIAPAEEASASLIDSLYLILGSGRTDQNSNPYEITKGVSEIDQVLHDIDSTPKNERAIALFDNPYLFVNEDVGNLLKRLTLSFLIHKKNNLSLIASSQNGFLDEMDERQKKQLNFMSLDLLVEKKSGSSKIIRGVQKSPTSLEILKKVSFFPKILNKTNIILSNDTKYKYYYSLNKNSISSKIKLFFKSHLLEQLLLLLLLLLLGFGFGAGFFYPRTKRKKLEDLDSN